MLPGFFLKILYYLTLDYDFYICVTDLHGVCVGHSNQICLYSLYHLGRNIELSKENVLPPVVSLFSLWATFFQPLYPEIPVHDLNRLYFIYRMY